MMTTEHESLINFSIFFKLSKNKHLALKSPKRFFLKTSVSKNEKVCQNQGKCANMCKSVQSARKCAKFCFWLAFG